MRFTTTALCCLAFIIFLSISIAKISHIISVDIDNLDNDENSYLFRGLKNNLDNGESSDKFQLTVSDSSEHLLWFLQISDIHISVFHDLSRVSDLKEFCRTTLDAIKPAVVLASGDLTDAKSADNIGSRQYIEEWRYYKSVLEQCKVEEKTMWLDVRGNHDSFNVPDLYSSVNYYRNYSVQGSQHLRSYMAQVRQGDETYSFIAVDACLNPGPRRPFNFVGVLGLSEFEQIQEFQIKASQEGNFTIWFGHYPTSCIISPSPGLRSLIGHSGLAYLCGHLHMLGGMVPNMYTLQHTGNLELELGDWKDNRLYRLMAIDHGLFSFIDIPHGEWPVILITNPKHALYAMPSKEPLGRMVNSTHIRVLVFSISSILSVRVKVGDEEWRRCEHVAGPLYVALWNTSYYTSGMHTIQVAVEDSEGRQGWISQPFTLDGSRLSFRLLPRLALMTNVSVIFQCMFGSMLIMCVVPLCIFRFIHHLVKRRKMRRPRMTIPIFHWWMRKLWILSTVDRMFYPLTLYALYLTVGPWFIGEVIEDHTGAIFAWGTITNGSYLPGTLTYAYGFLQMVTFHFPLTLFLAHCVDHRFHTIYAEDRCSMMCYVVRHSPFIFIVALQMALAYFFWLAYGTMAFVLGPLRTWSVILGVILWIQAVSLPEKCLKEANLVWTSKSAVMRASVAEDNDLAQSTTET